MTLSREQWLEERKKGIGGSDSAAVLGLNPYMTNVDLWQIKTGRKQQENVSQKPFVKYGTEAEKHYSFWEKDFDGMAYKTMLRQLISKWGIMSIDMLTALEKDMATIKDNGDPDYVDAQEPLTIDATPIDPETYAEPEETPQPTDNDPLA